MVYKSDHVCILRAYQSYVAVSLWLAAVALHDVLEGLTFPGDLQEEEKEESCSTAYIFAIHQCVFVHVCLRV